MSESGGGVSLYMREQLECIKLYPGTDEGGYRLWVRIKGPANMGNIVVGFHCSPPDQEEEIDEVSVDSWK